MRPHKGELQGEYRVVVVYRKLRRVFGADRRQGPRRSVLRRPHLRRHSQVEEDPWLADVPRRTGDDTRAVRLVGATRPPSAPADARGPPQRRLPQHGLVVHDRARHARHHRPDSGRRHRYNIKYSLDT